eukprot:68-Amphidinium_carterae.1
MAYLSWGGASQKHRSCLSMPLCRSRGSVRALLNDRDHFLHTYSSERWPSNHGSVSQKYLLCSHIIAPIMLEDPLPIPACHCKLIILRA